MLLVSFLSAWRLCGPGWGTTIFSWILSRWSDSGLGDPLAQGLCHVWYGRGCTAPNRPGFADLLIIFYITILYFLLYAIQSYYKSKSGAECSTVTFFSYAKYSRETTTIDTHCHLRFIHAMCLKGSFHILGNIKLEGLVAKECYTRTDIPSMKTRSLWDRRDG